MLTSSETLSTAFPQIQNPGKYTACDEKEEKLQHMPDCECRCNTLTYQLIAYPQVVAV